MDFFIDSGVVIGFSDQGDLTFHEPCKKFVKQYPIKTHGYFSLVYLIKEEIRDTELKRLIQRKKNIIKLFTQRAKRFCDDLKDIENTTHISFKHLFEKFHSYLLTVRKDRKRKEHDARFLASAFIWELEERKLITPHFITTDRGDISDNKKNITEIANNELSNISRLEIKFVIDMVP